MCSAWGLDGTGPPVPGGLPTFAVSLKRIAAPAELMMGRCASCQAQKSDNRSQHHRDPYQNFIVLHRYSFLTGNSNFLAPEDLNAPGGPNDDLCAFASIGPTLSIDSTSVQGSNAAKSAATAAKGAGLVLAGSALSGGYGEISTTSLSEIPVPLHVLATPSANRKWARLGDSVAFLDGTEQGEGFSGPVS